MRNFGYFVVVVGMLCLVGALAMDVSVSSGVGRVNNLGLMAERQNFILIGGLVLLIGVIMAVAGRRQKEVAGSSNDCRACPICAETIKCAAVKCRHCGSEIESVSNDVRLIAEPMDRETLQLWVARGVMYSIFVGIIVYSLYGK